MIQTYTEDNVKMNKKKEGLVTKILICLAKGLFFQVLVSTMYFQGCKTSGILKK